jgi:hypothetical protein
MSNKKSLPRLPSRSILPAEASLEAFYLSQTVLDVLKLLVAFLFVSTTGIGLAMSVIYFLFL